SVGRFEDARSALTLSPDPSFRLRGLEAVARSMGERGLETAAFAWIDREAARSDRDFLRRSVIDGTQKYIEGGRKPALKDRGILSPNQLDRLRNQPPAATYPSGPTRGGLASR